MNKTATLIKETFLHWYEKKAPRMGAAISYYALFSIAPLFILMIGLVRTVFDRSTVNTTIAHALRVTVGSNLGNSIQSIITSSYRTHTGALTAIVSGAVLIIAALSVLSELNSDLDELWHTPLENEETDSTVRTVMNFIKERLLSFLLILLCGLLLLFSIAFTVLFSFFHYSIPVFLQNSAMLQIADSVVSLGIGTILFTLIYRILPNTTLPWKEIIRGAFVTAVLFLIGKFLITWYVGAFGSTSTFGTASSIVGLLLWIYYSAQVFFIGASFTFVYSKRYGLLSRKQA